MEIEAAVARIGELEGQLATLTAERDTVAGHAAELEAARAALEGRLAEAVGEHDAASAELSETRGRSLTYLRRALLAELAGQLVPELVAGDDEDALLASVEVAQQAYARALESARVTLASQTVPTGAPSARVVSTAGLSPLEMIESGLRR